MVLGQLEEGVGDDVARGQDLGEQLAGVLGQLAALHGLGPRLQAVVHGREEAGMRQRIGVEIAEGVVLAPVENFFRGPFQGAALAGFHAGARMVQDDGPRAGGDLHGVVGAVVSHHENAVELARVVQARQAFHREPHHALLVVRGQQQREAAAPGRRRGRAAAPKPAEAQKKIEQPGGEQEDLRQVGEDRYYHFPHSDPAGAARRLWISIIIPTEAAESKGC